MCIMRVPPILSLDFQRVRQSILMDGSAYLLNDFTPSKDNYSSCNTDICAVLTHVYASFIHCQACTAVRDFVLLLSFLQKYFVRNQTPCVMETSSILLHRQHPVLEAGYGTRVVTSFTG